MGIFNFFKNKQVNEEQFNYFILTALPNLR